MGHDVVVVGGGSAGCVMAARLSEDPARRVLLVEAGPDHGSREATPADILDGRECCFNPAHDWGFSSEPDETGRSITLWRARLMGGCSAINATMALRGSPSDYDAWAAAGNPGWSFAQVLPFFRAAETDADFADEWHGTRGPLPIRRYSRNELTPLQHTFLEAAAACGHPEVEDHNRPGTTGVGPLPSNTLDGTRMNTALTYLAAARGRRNLEIRATAPVDRALVRAGRARGVVLADRTLLEADRVVLAAGAYCSPAVLMRSGMGPAEDLLALGIDVVADLPGVGRDLVDHPILGVDFTYRGAAAPGPKYQVLLTLRSSLAAGAAPESGSAGAPQPRPSSVSRHGVAERLD